MIDPCPICGHPKLECLCGFYKEGADYADQSTEASDVGLDEAGKDAWRDPEAADAEAFLRKRKLQSRRKWYAESEPGPEPD